MRKRLCLLLGILIVDPAMANDTTSVRFTAYGTSKRSVLEIQQCFELYASNASLNVKRHLLPFGIRLDILSPNNVGNISDSYEIENVGEFRRVTQYRSTPVTGKPNQIDDVTKRCLNNDS